MADDPQVYKLVCEVCGKVISSLYEPQAEHNMDEHKRTQHKNISDVKTVQK